MENTLQREDKVSDYVMYAETTEALHFATALAYYSRTRFVVNLL